MAEERANIDLVFRNGLKDFEVLPPADIWEGIQPSIRKPSTAAYYIRAAAAVAFLATTGLTAIYITNILSDEFRGTGITMNQEARPANSQIAGSGKQKPKVRMNKSIPTVLTRSPEQEVQESSGESEPVPSELSFSPDIFKFRPSGTIIYPSAARTPHSIPPLTVTGTETISYNYHGNESPAQSSGKNRWSIGAMLGPAYFSTIDGSGSEAQKTLAASENAAFSYSGGVSFAYKMNRRFSVQMGVYYSSLTDQVEGVKSFSGFTQYNSVKGSGSFTVQTSAGTVVAGNSDIFLINTKGGNKVTSVFSSEVFDPGKSGLSYLNSSIYQNFSYLEIPFTVRYRVIDKTLGFNVMGGFSYNQLLNNTAYSVSEGNKYLIGSTEGLYPIAITSSLGLGMEYSLSKKMSINLEPTFRYYLTPMGGQARSDVHPYTFGIFSGLVMKF